VDVAPKVEGAKATAEEDEEAVGEDEVGVDDVLPSLSTLE
jgi:hypothetical protein